jgi:hypothetical protein
MPRFSALQLEQPPIRKVPFVLANSGQKIDVGVQVLPAGARLDAIERARERCKKQGIEKWDDKDPTCSLEFFIEIVARATVTAESTRDAIEPFFDSADQVREDRRIGQENITYLYEVFEQHEAEYSIRPTKMSDVEAMAMCLQIASQDTESTDDFLDRTGPAMLKSLLRFMVARFALLLAGKSLLGSDESSSAKTSETSTSDASSSS